MSTRTPSLLVLGLALALAATTTTSPAAAGLPTNRMVGQRAADFVLKDARTGEDVRLYSFAGSKAVVLVFTGVDCPVGELYAPRLAEIAEKYRGKPVRFVAINSNASETLAQVASHAEAHKLPFPALKDPGNAVSDALLVERTNEVVVLDGLAFVRYRGAVDDQYAVGTRKPAATREYLVEAVDALLAGKRPAVASTDAAGCPLERVEPSNTLPRPTIRAAAPAIVDATRDEDAAAHVGGVTYANDVATILQTKCQGCHREGQVGPFPIATYDDARRRAAGIREVVSERRMPPWHADPRYGHFANDRSLTAAQRATLIAWVDQGTPLGDPASVPAAPSFADGWTIGTPDVVVEIPEPYTIAAQGALPYVRIVVPTNFKEDTWVQAAEARPTDRKVVHHIIVYIIDPAQKGKRKVEESHLCGYAPGDMPSVYPAGVAKRVPAGASFLFEIHYTPDGAVHTDRSKVGLVLAKRPPEHQSKTFPVANRDFLIAPGEPDARVDSSWTFDHDIYLLSFMPHMHLRGKDFAYTLTTPDGKAETLLSVPAYDFSWQSYYTLAAPRLLPAGSRIDCRAHFDNSAGNAANPNPKSFVKWGDQTSDEMMIGYIDYYDAAPLGTAPEVKPLPPTANNGTRPQGPVGQVNQMLRKLSGRGGSR